jgi:hypothetical protein
LILRGSRTLTKAPKGSLRVGSGPWSVIGFPENENGSDTRSLAPFAMPQCQFENTTPLLADRLPASFSSSPAPRGYPAVLGLLAKVTQDRLKAFSQFTSKGVDSAEINYISNSPTTPTGFLTSLLSPHHNKKLFCHHRTN